MLRLPATLKLAIAFARIAGNVLVGALLVAVYFPLVGPLRRAQLIRWWARGVLRVCGLRIEVVGHALHGHPEHRPPEHRPPDHSPPHCGGVLLVANHISWLDIYLINAVAPTRFVAKSEIRSWPVFGWLAARTGTLFLERGRRHAVHRAIAHVAAELRKAARVGIFPEGTTGDGRSLLPFHANLLEAAIEAGVPVQPVALSYSTLDGQVSTAPAFVGDLTLIGSICQTVLAAPLVARVEFLPAIDCTGRRRHDIARLAAADIALSLGVDAVGTRPGTARDRRVAVQ